MPSVQVPLVFTFARHGETADNARHVFQGQAGKGLNARGRAQAARLAERVGKSPPDALYASDLDRAVETARIVGQAAGLEPVLERDLREVDLGAWTGKSHIEIQALYPEEWAAWSAGLDVRRGGGETYGELAERVERAVVKIAAACAAAGTRRVLIISHGGAIRSYVARVLGITDRGLHAIAGVGNCGLTVFERDATGAMRLHAFNDAAHLEGLTVEQETD